MMKTICFPFCLILGLLVNNFSSFGQTLKTPFELDENYSAAYHEVIDHYQELASLYPNQVEMTAHGKTDIGLPLHTIVIDKDGDFTPAQAKANNKLILFINNGIHPGEPCGIDATMMLARDLLNGKLNSSVLDEVTLVIIPMYNIGGSINRGPYSRANQNGPAQYGFRGNAQNLDLNRDFVKADTKNAQNFNRIYGVWKPHVFIDNHTSNGSDYQYSITLIATQHNKLQKDLAQLMNEDMLPFLYQSMEKHDWEMTPYVYARSTPDQGIAGFLDLARYSSGYAALHNAISFMPETHMLKPFKNRVWSTYYFMESMLNYMDQNKNEIQETRAKADAAVSEQSSFDINWTMDQSQFDSITFKGYTPKYKPSLISGKDRLYYDHNEPFEKKIPYFNYYKASKSIDKPIAYLIPQAYSKVIERLQWNGVEMSRLKEDVQVETEMYYIADYKSRNSPYEGHYLHYGVELDKKVMQQTWRKGDVVVYANQTSNRYIIETLEPQAPDGFFAWNFFDGILMKKEHFSSYVFEDTAVEYLKSHPALKAALEKKKAEDKEFAESARAQLNFIYENSPYYEPTFNRYPVGRLVKEQTLGTK